MTDTNKTTDSSTPPGRKPYTAPRLVSYGHVKDIVRSGQGPKGEAGGSKS